MSKTKVKKGQTHLFCTIHWHFRLVAAATLTINNGACAVKKKQMNFNLTILSRLHGHESDMYLI